MHNTENYLQLFMYIAINHQIQQTKNLRISFALPLNIKHADIHFLQTHTNIKQTTIFVCFKDTPIQDLKE